MIGSDLSALFVCRSSPYLSLGVDCFDFQRDALSYAGSGLVIAHPPCRAWGRYKSIAKPLPGEKDLALWALDLVRLNGGVLEHPASSSLWSYLRPGETTLLIRQADFGHRAEKLTRLFYALMPRVPLFPDPASGPFRPVELMGRQERERTPFPLAQWLVTWCKS
jgi:hypothetical protein